MNHLIFLTESTTGALSMGFSILWILGCGAVFYFLAIRPQKKQQKEHLAVVSSLEVGDSVLTTSGFYGVIIDVMDEVVVVEFGNNKNCRIPMKKSAVVEVEKSNSNTNA